MMLVAGELTEMMTKGDAFKGFPELLEIGKKAVLSARMSEQWKETGDDSIRELSVKLAEQVAAELADFQNNNPNT